MKFEYENAFKYFNALFFKDRLRLPKFQFDATKKFAMRCSEDELTIGSEIINCSIFESLINLLHEMIHMHNSKRQIVDLGINQYHKKEFLHVGLELGFFVIKHRRQGWCLLSTFMPRNVTYKANVKVPDAEDNRKLIDSISTILQNRSSFCKDYRYFNSQIERLSPPKPFLLKYQCCCAAPHNSIRSGRRPVMPSNSHPSAMCKACGSDFICTSKLPD
jgi:hypothetical protein